MPGQEQMPKKRFGHTSGQRLPQYVRYGTDKKGRREIVPPPVKTRPVKRSHLAMKPTHPLRRLVANWGRKEARR